MALRRFRIWLGFPGSARRRGVLDRFKIFGGIQGFHSKGLAPSTEESPLDSISGYFEHFGHFRDGHSFHSVLCLWIGFDILGLESFGAEVAYLFKCGRFIQRILAKRPNTTLEKALLYRVWRYAQFFGHFFDSQTFHTYHIGHSNPEGKKNREFARMCLTHSNFKVRM